MQAFQDKTFQRTLTLLGDLAHVLVEFLWEVKSDGLP
jgi:hypothetical protein